MQQLLQFVPGTQIEPSNQQGSKLCSDDGDVDGATEGNSEGNSDGNVVGFGLGTALIQLTSKF